MLPQPYRLHLRQQADFFQTAQRFSTRFLLWYYQSHQVTKPQVAVIVPKKKIAKVVRRNFLKRVVYEQLYQQREALPSLPIVVYWKVSSIPSREEIKTDINHGLKKIQQSIINH